MCEFAVSYKLEPFDMFFRKRSCRKLTAYSIMQ